MGLPRSPVENAALASLRRFQNVTGHPGHSHFFQRLIRRRAFLGLTAGATLTPTMFGKRHSGLVDPKPIPGGIPFLSPPDPTVFHIFPPNAGMELSAITDFNGFVGATELQGAWAKVSGPGPIPVGTLNWDADMRFMVGVYIGVDKKPHEGVFGFV